MRAPNRKPLYRAFFVCGKMKLMERSGTEKTEKVFFKKSGAAAWVVAVDMGYGHQRAAYPLRHLALKEKVINANHYSGIPIKDRKIWEWGRRFYEFVSNLKKIPVAGKLIFKFYNKFQRILNFYPRRDLSKPSFQLKMIFSLVKKGWGRHLIDKLKSLSRAEPEHRPFISTFFIPVFMAEVFDYPGDIFCVVCDVDISRVWAPLKPSESRIKYLVSTERAAERLKLYGVKPEKIFLTGYPLPLENIGDEKMAILKHDIAHRLVNLDPKGRYTNKYSHLIKDYLGDLPKEPDHPLSLMFSLGGAGAQKEIAVKILKSLFSKITEGRIKIILAVGIYKKIKDYFFKNIVRLGLAKELGKRIEIIFAADIEHYFHDFNLALRKTDILWTKPSELSFYTALGLPIIIAPTIGSQEDFNKEWLLRLGSAIEQENPDYADQWLFDFLDNGWFAEAAMQGFVEGEKSGTFNIEKIVKGYCKNAENI